MNIWRHNCWHTWMATSDRKTMSYIIIIKKKKIQLINRPHHRLFYTRLLPTLKAAPSHPQLPIYSSVTLLRFTTVPLTLLSFLFFFFHYHLCSFFILLTKKPTKRTNKVQLRRSHLEGKTAQGNAGGDWQATPLRFQVSPRRQRRLSSRRPEKRTKIHLVRQLWKATANRTQECNYNSSRKATSHGAFRIVCWQGVKPQSKSWTLKNNEWQVIIWLIIRSSIMTKT